MTPADVTPSLGRVLLVTAGVGGGHLRAAQAVEQALRLGAAEGRWALDDLRLLDVLDFASPPFRLAYRDGYLGLIRRAPTLLGWLYERSDAPWRGRGMRSVINRLGLTRLGRMIQSERPDRVISTHFLASEFVADLRSRGAVTCELTTVVTDMDVHGLWFVEPCERFFVATAEAREILVAGGVAEERVEVTGIPIDPRFAALPSREEARRALGLPAEGPVVLFASGGAGTGRLEEIFRALLQLRRPAHLVAICGRNEAATRALGACVREGACPPDVSAQVVGFTHRMHEWMAAADLLVGKPGGLTSSEARAAGLPTVIVDPVPGQEERNADHLLEWGVAVRSNTLATLGWKVGALLDDGPRMEAMRRKALGLARPRSAERVAELVAAGVAGRSSSGLAGASRSAAGSMPAASAPA